MFKRKMLIILPLTTSLFAVPMPANIKEKLEQLWEQHIENVSVQTYVLPYDEQHPQPDRKVDLTTEELEKLGSPVIYADLQHTLDAGKPLTTPIDLHFIDSTALFILKNLTLKEPLPLTIDEQNLQVLANTLMAADIYQFNLTLLNPLLTDLNDNTLCHLYTFFTQDQYPAVWAILDAQIQKRLSYTSRTIEAPKSADFIKANSAGNRVVTASANYVQIFDLLNNGSWQLTSLHIAQDIFSFALSADGNRFVVGSEDSTIQIFDLVNGTWRFTQQLGQAFNQDITRGNRGSITSLALSSDGNRLVSGCTARDIIVWDFANGHWDRVNRLEDAEFYDEHFCIATNSIGNRIIRGSEDGTIKVWDFVNDTWQPTHTLRTDDTPIDVVVLSADGRRIVANTRDGRIKIYDFVNNDWQLTQTINSQDADVNGNLFDYISLSTDGNSLFIGASNTTIKIFELVNGTWQLKENLGESGASSIAVSSNRIFSSDNDTTITIWNKESANDFCNRVASELYAQVESLEEPAAKRARTV